jgi:hypothetical protein
MARYNTVKIGSSYLTQTGAAGGVPCKLSINNLDQLFTEKTGSVSNSADGTPFLQVVDVGQKGITLEILVETLTKDVFDDVVTAINSAVDDLTTIDFEISGDTGNFTGSAIPAMPKPITAASFRNQYIQNVTIRLVTT